MTMLTDNSIFAEALSQSSSFDPILQELCLKGLDLGDMVASTLNPKEKIRILKGLARNSFKQFLIEPEPMMVMKGLAPSLEERTTEMEQIMEHLRPLYRDSFLEANKVTPKKPLGYYAIRSGANWIEVTDFKTATDPEVLALRDRAEITNHFG